MYLLPLAFSLSLLDEPFSRRVVKITVLEIVIVNLLVTVIVIVVGLIVRLSSIVSVFVIVIEEVLV